MARPKATETAGVGFKVGSRTYSQSSIPEILSAIKKDEAVLSAKEKEIENQLKVIKADLAAIKKGIKMLDGSAAAVPASTQSQHK